jgi:hypothetical protein
MMFFGTTTQMMCLWLSLAADDDPAILVLVDSDQWVSKISGSCEEREWLWQHWVDASALLERSDVEFYESARAGEQATRHLLNQHLRNHQWRN